jgi:hypothetical protein
MKFANRVRVVGVVRCVVLSCHRGPKSDRTKHLAIVGIWNSKCACVMGEMGPILRSILLPCNVFEQSISWHNSQVLCSYRFKCCIESHRCLCGKLSDTFKKCQQKLQQTNEKHPKIWMGSAHNYSILMQFLNSVDELSHYSKHFIVSNTSKFLPLLSGCDWR